jgi:hypothetical protein
LTDKTILSLGCALLHVRSPGARYDDRPMTPQRRQRGAETRGLILSTSERLERWVAPHPLRTIDTRHSRGLGNSLALCISGTLGSQRYSRSIVGTVHQISISAGGSRRT